MSSLLRLPFLAKKRYLDAASLELVGRLRLLLGAIGILARKPVPEPKQALLVQMTDMGVERVQSSVVLIMISIVVNEERKFSPV